MLHNPRQPKYAMAIAIYLFSRYKICGQADGKGRKSGASSNRKGKEAGKSKESNKGKGKGVVKKEKTQQSDMATGRGPQIGN